MSASWLEFLPPVWALTKSTAVLQQSFLASPKVFYGFIFRMSCMVRYMGRVIPDSPIRGRTSLSERSDWSTRLVVVVVVVVETKDRCCPDISADTAIATTSTKKRRQNCRGIRRMVSCGGVLG